MTRERSRGRGSVADLGSGSGMVAGMGRAASPRGEHRADRQCAGVDVELRIGSGGSWLSVARVVVADIAMRAGFDLDGIDDVRLAMDEACSQLLALSEGEAAVTCRFRLGDSGMRVVVSAPASGDPTRVQGSFGWHVLTVVTDALWLEGVSSHVDSNRATGGSGSGAADESGEVSIVFDKFRG